MSVILVSPETTASKPAQESWDGTTSRSEDRADEGEMKEKSEVMMQLR